MVAGVTDPFNEHQSSHKIPEVVIPVLRKNKHTQPEVVIPVKKAPITITRSSPMPKIVEMDETEAEIDR